jgi:hypothetical protein
VIAEARRSIVPWEANGASAPSRFLRTVGQLVRSPARFFLQISEGSGRKAEAFAYVVSLIGLVGYFSAQALLFADDHGDLSGALAELAEGTFPAPSSLAIARFFRWCLYLTPLLALFPVHIAAGLYQVGLFLVGASGRAYDVTFRVTAYGLAPMVLLCIPGFGLLLAPGWILALHWVGLAVAHRLSLTATAIAMAIPLLLFVIVAVPAVVPVILHVLQVPPLAP